MNHGKVKTSIHHSFMNTLPVLASQIFKINNLPTLKNAFFHHSRSNNNSSVQNNIQYVELWLEKKILFEIDKMSKKLTHFRPAL